MVGRKFVFFSGIFKHVIAVFPGTCFDAFACISNDVAHDHDHNAVEQSQQKQEARRRKVVQTIAPTRR